MSENKQSEVKAGTPSPERLGSPAILFRCLYCGKEHLTVEACNACEETH